MIVMFYYQLDYINSHSVFINTYYLYVEIRLPDTSPWVGEDGGIWLIKATRTPARTLLAQMGFQDTTRKFRTP